MSDLNQTEVETKLENDKLMKEKEALEEMLQQSQESLEESKSYIGQLRSQQKDEKRERARAALHLTENIALERESLVKQLDLLRDVNKKLRDDKDEAETRFWSQKQMQRGSASGTRIQPNAAPFSETTSLQAEVEWTPPKNPSRSFRTTRI